MKNIRFLTFILLFLVGVLLFAPTSFALDGVCLGGCDALDYSPPTSDGSGSSYDNYNYDPGPSAEELQAQQDRAEAHALNESANALYESSRFEAAIAEYQRALALNPGSDVIRQNLANAQAELRADAATKDNDTGNIYYKNNNLDEAIKYYKNALKNAPGDPVIKENLRFAEEDLKQKNKNRAQAAQAEKNIRSNIDELSKTIARPTATTESPSIIAGSSSVPDKKPGGAKMGFMRPAPNPAGGDNVKAGDQLKSSLKGAKESIGKLDFMGAGDGVPDRETAKRKSGISFDTAGDKAGSLPVVAIDGHAPADALPQEIEQLSPDIRKALDKDPEYKKWRKDEESATKELRAVSKQIESTEKRIGEATKDAEKIKLQTELVNLRDKESAAESKKAAAHINIKEKIKKLSFHEDAVE